MCGVSRHYDVPHHLCHFLVCPCYLHGSVALGCLAVAHVLELVLPPVRFVLLLSVVLGVGADAGAGVGAGAGGGAGVGAGVGADAGAGARGCSRYKCSEWP